MANKSKASGSNGASGSAKGKVQPRSVSQDLTAQRPGLYKAGMYQELQKFGNKERVRQLLLTEGMEGTELDNQIEITGLDLSVTEDKALHAILRLLDGTGYKGNMPPEEITPRGYRERISLPRLQISWSEYLEAYGLSSQTKGKGRLEAIEALEALQKLRRVAYRRRYLTGEGKSRRRLSDVVVTQSPLIRLTKVYRGLEEEEADQIIAGQDIPGRVTSLVIEFSPLLVDRIESFYLLKPVTLFQEIEDHLGSRRISQAVPLFLQWLMTKNTPTVRIAKKLLAERLRLQALLEQRKPSLLDKRLQEAIQTAQTLDYLLAYEEDAFGVYTFHLNPERCSRIASIQPAEDEEQEP